MGSMSARQASATRQRLVEAALGELDEKGLTALRVDDVARRAGVTTGAIYGAFGSKHDLLVAALQERHPTAIRDALRSRPRGETTGRVLDEAFSALDRKGYRAVRSSDVARRAGVTTEALAKLYPTKHHLLAAAMLAHGPPAFRAAAESADPASDGAVDQAAPTSERLLVAALGVLDERGYRDATVGDIARRAGLTTGAIYATFGSKENLLNAALGRRYEGLFRTSLDEVEEARAGGGLLGSLASTLNREAAIEHRAIMEVLAAASRDEPVRPAVTAQLARRHQVIKTMFESAQDAGLVDARVSADALAHVVQLVALGNVVGQAVGLQAPEPAEVTTALEVLGEGLRDPGSDDR